MTLPMKITPGIAYYDAHNPYQDKELFKKVLKVARDIKTKIFLLGGDNMNMSAFDHWLHDKGMKRPLEGRRIRAEYKQFIEEIYNPIMNNISSKCRKVWLDGNHELWGKQAIDKDPQGEGYWEIENNIPLKRDNWETYKYGQHAKIGKFYAIHGEYTTKYHAAKTLDVYEKSTIAGHCHTSQSFTKVVPIGNEPHCCYSVPCGCNLNPEYRKNRPNAWVNGFAVFYLYGNGWFNFYPIIAINGHFVFNGKYY